MKKSLIAMAILSLLFSQNSLAQKSTTEYRTLSKNIRPQAQMQIAMPNGELFDFSYDLKMADALFPNPLMSTIRLGSNENEHSISFWDKIMTTEDSSLNIGNEKLPITCIFVHGQDNRNISELSPLFPQFIMNIYIVVGDYTCAGPLNPGWPQNGGKKELWDTYIHYQIKDPTIMLPTDITLRLRWNEYSAYLNK